MDKNMPKAFYCLPLHVRMTLYKLSGELIHIFSYTLQVINYCMTEDFI